MAVVRVTRLLKLSNISTTETDYVIITDADFTYPAKYVPEMIQKLEKNPHIGMVCGNRFIEEL